MTEAAFDEALDLLLRRLRDADHLNVSELHSFRELMRDYAAVLPDHFYFEAFEELQLLGYLSPASAVTMGGDAHARLSADGLAYLRKQDEERGEE